MMDKEAPAHLLVYPQLAVREAYCGAVATAAACRTVAAPIYDSWTLAPAYLTLWMSQAGERSHARQQRGQQVCLALVAKSSSRRYLLHRLVGSSDRRCFDSRTRCQHKLVFATTQESCHGMACLHDCSLLQQGHR